MESSTYQSLGFTSQAFILVIIIASEKGQGMPDVVSQFTERRFESKNEKYFKQIAKPDRAQLHPSEALMEGDMIAEEL
jgi:hypothetical protein